MRFSLLMVIFLWAFTGASGETYYVSPTGSDSTGDGSMINPWASPAHGYARLSAGDTLIIRGGRYYIPSEIPLWNQGTIDKRITIQAYFNPENGEREEVVLDGTRAITDWQACTPDDDFLNIGLPSDQFHPHWETIYKAKLPDPPSNLRRLRLFEDNERVRMAMWPITQVAFGTDTSVWIETTEEAWGYTDRIIDTTNLTQPDGYWGGTGFVIGLISSDRSSPQTKDIDYFENSTLFLKDEFSHPLSHFSDGTGDLYSIFNHPNALVEAGMFVVTMEPDGNGDYWVYYWPNNADNLSNDKVRYAKTGRCFNIRWTYAHAEPGGAYHTIDGFTIMGFSSYSIRTDIPSGQTVKGTIIRNCTIQHNGREVNLAKLENTLIEDCDISKNEYFGILLETSTINTTIKNCYIGKNLRSQIYTSGTQFLRIICNTFDSKSGAKGNAVSIYGAPNYVLIAKNDFRGNGITTHSVSNVIYYCNKGLNQIRYYSTSENPGLQMFLHNVVLGGTRANAIRSYSRSLGDLYIVNNALNGAAPWNVGGVDEPSEIPEDAVRDHSCNLYTATWMMETGRWSRVLWDGEIKAVNTKLNDIWVYIDAHRDEFGNELVGMDRWDMAAVASWDDNNYAPAVGSPLIESGKPIAGILEQAGVLGDGSWTENGQWLDGFDDIFETDFAGNVWGTKPSIGAYEYTGDDSQKTASVILSISSLGAEAVNIESSSGHSGTTSYDVNVNKDSMVTLTAPERVDGNVFSHWAGVIYSYERTITVLMDENKSVTAHYKPEIKSAAEPDFVARWGLTEEAVNGRVSDLSVNMHTATAEGNVTFESGMGARFDGSDGYLRVADADSLDMQEPMTISVWIWPMGATPFAKLVVKPYAAYASPWEMYAIDLGSSGDTPRFIVTDGIAGGRIAVAANSDVKLQTGQWYHLVAVYDGQSIALYLDGRLIAQQSVDFAIGTNNQPLCIGGRMGLNTFDGYINDVKIYQGAFTPEQVSGIFSRDRNGGLAGHWLFERPYVAEVTDVVSGQKAELVDQPDWGEGWAAEYFVRLTDGRQAVQIPMDGSTAEAGTIGLWVQPEAATDTETASALQLLFGHAVNSDDNRITLYTVESTDAEGNTVHKLALGLGDNAALQDNIAQLVSGQLYHVALTWDGTTYAVFVDGVRRDAGTFSGLAELEAFADVGNFGTASGRAYASGFRGLVDEIRLYRRALGSDEIERLFLTHTVNENRPIEFVVSGYDQAGNRISYTAAKLPDGATFDEQTQTFSWRPSLYNAAGHYEVVFAAADQPEQTVTIAVRDVALAGWYIAFLEQHGLH